MLHVMFVSRWGCRRRNNNYNKASLASLILQKGRTQYARTHTNATGAKMGLLYCHILSFILDAVSVVVFIIPQIFRAPGLCGRRFHSNDTNTSFIMHSAVRWLEFIYFCFATKLYADLIIISCERSTFFGQKKKRRTRDSDLTLF